MTEKVLIVDDEPITVKYLSIFLTRLGYETLQAHNGSQALKIAQEQQPNVIVLDVMMPEMDGYEVARRLRRHAETAQIPIMMFTANGQIEDQQAGYEAGADLYMVKPVPPADFQAGLKNLLEHGKTRDAGLVNQAYVIGVVAAKGGLGVSTIALNMAIAYRQAYKARVVAVETRPGQGSWGDELGITPTSGLNELLGMNRDEICPSVVQSRLTSARVGFPLLLASPNGGENGPVGAPEQYRLILEGLRTQADLVVLDIGSGFHPAYEVFTDLCDEMLIITEPQPLAVKRTRGLIADLKRRNFGCVRPLSLVTVNRVRLEMNLSLANVEDALGFGVSMGIPPASELSYQAINRSMPIYLVKPDSIFSKQIERLAEHIHRHIH